jgi:hypothetical protein
MTESNVKFFNTCALCLTVFIHAAVFFLLINKQHDAEILQSNRMPPLHLQILPVQQPPALPVVAWSAPVSATVTTEQVTAEKNERQDGETFEAKPITHSTEHYYSDLELSERAQVIQDLPEDFWLPMQDSDPPSAIVLVMINEEGEVDDVEIKIPEASTPRLAEETQRALKIALKKMRFSPGKSQAML